MNTPTHLLVGAAAFARPGQRRINTATLAGALIPDLSIFVLYLWSRVVEGEPAWRVWRVIYWSEPWQTISAISNSAPLWAFFTAAGLVARVPWIAVLGGAALLHVTLDFPVHSQDAHQHFWPLSEWRFNSPISYWDDANFGSYVAILEVALCLSLILVLIRRFPAPWVRVALGLALVSYAAVPAYFWLTLG